MSKAFEARVVGKNDRTSSKGRFLLHFLPDSCSHPDPVHRRQTGFQGPALVLSDIHDFRLTRAEARVFAAGEVAIVDPFRMPGSGVNQINTVVLTGPLGVVGNVLPILGSDGFTCLSMFAATEVLLLLPIDAAKTWSPSRSTPRP